MYMFVHLGGGGQNSEKIGHMICERPLIGILITVRFSISLLAFGAMLDETRVTSESKDSAGLNDIGGHCCCPFSLRFS